jgi:hypothetical protein
LLVNDAFGKVELYSQLHDLTSAGHMKQEMRTRRRGESRSGKTVAEVQGSAE